MAIKMHQSQRQEQTLTFSPQMQQAVKLLTLTHLELTNLIGQEMIENPMLEETGGEVELSGEGEKEGQSEYEGPDIEQNNQEAQSENFDAPDVVAGKEDVDWNKYIESFNTSSSAPAPSMAKSDPDEMPTYENMVSREMTLPEHLEWQLRMESLNDGEWEVAHQIIHNLDDDGYLESTFDEILEQVKLPREDAQEVLKMIQALDPVGCGSTSLKECLLIQARTLTPRSPLVEKLINDHLEDLKVKDYIEIHQKTGIDIALIKDAELIIQQFNPRPGRLISSEETHYIVPDIYIRYVGGELSVELNDEGVPNLRINKLYQNLLAKGKGLSASDKAASDYVQDKLRSAVWLIKSIQNRQKTIYKVAEAIVRYQPEFFKKGASALKPMVLKDIAAEIGVHESTVSRVTTNKYMHTPIGTFELKYFFNTGIGGDRGGIDIAGETLKLKIKAFCDSESPARPLSDQKIVELLAREGVVVARRTVAKYRELLGIPSSADRKKIKRV